MNGEKREVAKVENSMQTEDDLLPGCIEWDKSMEELNAFLQNVDLQQRMLDINRRVLQPSVEFPVCVGCKTEIKKVVFRNHRYCDKCIACDNEERIYLEGRIKAEKWLEGCFGLVLYFPYRVSYSRWKKFTFSREAIRKSLLPRRIKCRQHMKESEILPDMIFSLSYCWCKANAKKCKKMRKKEVIIRRAYKWQLAYWARIQWLYWCGRTEQALLYKAVIPQKWRKIFGKIEEKFPFSEFTKEEHKEELRTLVEKNPFAACFKVEKRRIRDVFRQFLSRFRKIKQNKSSAEHGEINGCWRR